MELNDEAPYRHWHTVCAACGKVTLARPCSVPGKIKAVEHNPVVKCQHREDTRQYLTKDCFLAPLSAAATADKSAGAFGSRRWADRSGQVGKSGVWRDTEQKSTRPICYL